MLWFLVVAVPAVTVAAAAGRFAYNHFFVDGPYLQDSGQYAHVLYRAGLLPKNPAVGYATVDYFSLHLSPAIAFASVLSYLFPGDRVSWFCLLDALAYAPLGLVVPLLPKGPRTRAVTPALALGLASLAFAMSGQVISCMTFPHHEILIADGLCLVLLGVARGDQRFAWAGLFLAVAAREDGGLHVAAFVAAPLLAAAMGRALPLARTVLVRLFVVALVASGVAFFVQAHFFARADLVVAEYTGKPAFAHVTASLLAARLGALPRVAAFVVLPFFATVAVAARRRDPAYLFGWLVAVPWFLLNLCAVQELKSRFAIYTGFPFIASMFWVLAYSSCAKRARRSDVVDYALLVSFCSFAGYVFSFPAAFDHWIHRAVEIGDVDAGALRDFTAMLRTRPSGRVYVDGSMAAWTVDKVQPGDVIFDASQSSDTRHEGVAFFRSGMVSNGSIFGWLSRSAFTRCGRLTGTEAFYCTAPRQPLPESFVASSPLLRAIHPLPGVAAPDLESLAIEATAEPRQASFGPFTPLEPGDYVATWTISGSLCADKRRGHVDVSQFTDVVASHDVDGESVSVAFRASASDPRPFEFRAWTGDCRYVIHDLRLRASAAPEPAPARPENHVTSKL